MAIGNFKRKRSASLIQAAVPAIATAARYARYAYNGYRAYKKAKLFHSSWSNSQKQQPILRGYVNDQHQTKTMYKKRKRRHIPKRRYRKIRRFKRAVRKIVHGNQPTNCYLQKMDGEGIVGLPSIATADIKIDLYRKQRWIGNSSQWGCWVPDGAAGNNDVAVTVYHQNYYNTVYAGGIRALNTEREVYKGAKITSFNHILSIYYYEPAPQTLTIDLYQFVAVQDITDANLGNPVAAMTYLGLNYETNGGSAISLNRQGITPWDFPGLAKYWKVVRKQRFILPKTPNDPLNSMRQFDMGNRKGWYNQAKFQGKQAVKGKTMYWALCINPIPNEEFGATSNLPLFKFNLQKMIHFKYPNGAPPNNPVVQTAFLPPPTA